MDYLQYPLAPFLAAAAIAAGFKPYYKWITFNTYYEAKRKEFQFWSFKPYYKWITFNTSFTKCSR